MCTTGHHEPIEAGSLPMANHFFGVDTAPSPAKPSATFAVGDAVFALPYDLGAEIRLATQGYSAGHVHGELSRITNIVSRASRTLCRSAPGSTRRSQVPIPTYS